VSKSSSTAAVSPSTATVRGTTSAVRTSTAAVVASTATVSASSTTAPAAEAAAAPDEPFAARASAAMIALATAYTEKRRSAFMRLVSDDFDGELGTLEDALSSDFRSYRTIDLSVIPTQVTEIRGKALVVFTYNLNITDDQGVNNKFAGQASYTFVDEKGKAKLFRMDRTPIFGTSLSSIDNPMAASQGAAPGQGANAPGCRAPVTGNSTLGTDSGNGFKFASQQVVSQSASDFIFTGLVLTQNGAGVVDVGPCSLLALIPPASITGVSAPQNVGDCYAFRTATGQYGAIKITGSSGATYYFQYAYQPSGARCFR